jgi:hypothetical protein
MCSKTRHDGTVHDVTLHCEDQSVNGTKHRYQQSTQILEGYHQFTLNREITAVCSEISTNT